MPSSLTQVALVCRLRLAMAEAGWSVLVLDRAPSPGAGLPQGRNRRRPRHPSDPAKIGSACRSLEVFSHVARDLWPGHRVRPPGAIRCCLPGSRGADSEGRADHPARARPEHRLARRRGLLDVVPTLNPDGLLGGTYSPDDGHCSTLLAGHAFYETAIRQQGELSLLGTRDRDIQR